MASRSADIILLLGAGASVDAGIPASETMRRDIESLLVTNDEWKPFKELYDHVKSAIYYSAGLKGCFEGEVQYNIETLVNTLYELERNEEHPLYPFIASWNSRFATLAENDFGKVREFRRLILKQLKKWMCPEDGSLGSYYRGIAELQRYLNYPLHTFSLNYDLCMERLNTPTFRVETGFEDYGPNYLWDWERFEDSGTGPNLLPEVFLYKLHGSIAWKRDEAKNLYCVEQIETVDSDQMDVIFGRDFKLEAADPYLFYAYQFRRFTLRANLIVAIGYGFADSHINKMLTQALRGDEDRRLMLVARCENDDEMDTKKKMVAETLDSEPERIMIERGSAKSFLEQEGLGERLIGHIAKPEDAPF